MSLREYILRQQAHTRDSMETTRLQTLPLLNVHSEDIITVKDFFGGTAGDMTEEEINSLEKLRNDVAKDKDIDTDPVDKQLHEAKAKLQ